VVGGVGDYRDEWIGTEGGGWCAVGAAGVLRRCCAADRLVAAVTAAAAWRGGASYQWGMRARRVAAAMAGTV
jgi:hypothetical protein